MEGVVHLTVNRTPRDDRRLYPDPNEVQSAYGPLQVFWLEVYGTQQARANYERWPDKPVVLASLTTIDKLLGSGILIPKTKMEKFVHRGINIYEIKAPQSGRRIFRLLAYREVGWDFFVALADEKKSQDLPDSWKDTAAKRIANALREGRPL